MPSATTPDSAPPFDAGRALALSVSLLTSNGGALALLTVLIQLPALAFQFYQLTSPAASEHAQQQQAAIAMGVGMYLTALATTAVVYRIFAQIQGKSLSFGESMRFAVGRAWVVLLINLLTFIAFALGSLAFLVPGLFAATVLFVAAPVAVAEGRGALASLRRSVELTRGARWGVFTVLIVPASFAIGLHLAALLAVGDLHAKNPIENPRFQAISAVLSVLFQAVIAVTATVTYLELRRRVESGARPSPAVSPD